MKTVNNFPVPETPEEIMQFIEMNFNSVRGLNEQGEAMEDTTISLTVHDLLSAFSYWLDAYGLE